MTIIESIVMDPNIAMGKPTIKGTRISVDFLLEKLATWESIDEIIEEYPKLDKNKIYNALRWAALDLYYPRPIYEA